jgi:hypothetical protein
MTEVARANNNLLDLSGVSCWLQCDIWSEVSQSLQTVKYGHESLGTRNQELLCWRGPTAIK